MELSRRGGLLLCLGLLAMQGASAQRQQLTVAAFPAVDEIVKAAIPAWNRLHPDVEIKLVSRALTDHHTAMTTALSTSAHLPDVMAVEVGYLGRFAQGGGLEDLSRAPYSIAQYQSRFVAYAYQQATNRRGQVVAAPTDIGPGTLLYRSDLLAKAGVGEAELTRTWESYVAAGVKIKAATGAYLMAHARDMKDIVIRTGIQPGEGLFFDSRSNVLVNTPRFARAFELARQVRRNKLDAKVNAWSSDWTEGFKRGGIATQMMGAWLAGHLNTWLAPDTRGLWRAAQLPEGAFAAYGGTFYAIPRAASAAQKPMAWEFIKLMTLTRELQLGAFKAQDAFPALLETFDDPFFDQPIAFLGGQQARVGWRTAARRITAVDVHKQDAFADEVINTELDKVLVRGKDIATALADAERLLRQRAFR
ncbi:ABC transporter substrate-binding protein [Roseateles toxinivorans]|uniref:Multiple sugar transport system substrate-binding protein n=1 Tax=Roseateles toxinivorans TaxID=270368 RepID=A0A4R6QHN9_9BURK|nr:extracellular solute-binding protein [Roseateles toxinivorans]TDP62837.1 multiple sugar transport system substrate-binding protein [Roseateles toxinivorans]